MSHYHKDFQNIMCFNPGYFRSKFKTFLNKLGVKPNYDEFVAHILTEVMCHEMSDRYYHTAVHVMAMFDFAEENNITLTDAEQLAIWFHDAIYDVNVKSFGPNEEASAAFMDSLLMGKIDRGLLDTAYRIIEDTARHLEPGILTSYKVMDLDLSSFAYDYEQYKRVCEFLRMESGLDKKTFMEKRGPFIDQLFSHKYGPYRTEEFAKFEAKARENEERFRKDND